MFARTVPTTSVVPLIPLSVVTVVFALDIVEPGLYDYFLDLQPSPYCTDHDNNIPFSLEHGHDDSGNLN